MRRKPWARPELAACPYYIDDPTRQKNRWRTLFARPQQPLHLELGCGKGSFMAQLASRHPDINYVAMDIKSEMLAIARRNIQRTYGDLDLPVDNVLLASQEIELIHEALGPEDQVDRIYINFCNPWPKSPYHKKRLTHVKQLIKYVTFLRDGGELHFKTDDDGLFKDSLEYFAQCGFPLLWQTRDLHRERPEGNIQTEHETLFAREGILIKGCAVRYERAVTDPAIEALIRQDERLRLRQILTGEGATMPKQDTPENV